MTCIKKIKKNLPWTFVRFVKNLATHLNLFLFYCLFHLLYHSTKIAFSSHSTTTNKCSTPANLTLLRKKIWFQTNHAIFFHQFFSNIFFSSIFCHQFFLYQFKRRSSKNCTQNKKFPFGFDCLVFFSVYLFI